MNIINFFEFLEDKKGRSIPVVAKLVYGVPLTKGELTVRGDVFLQHSTTKTLPEGLHVVGSLVLYYSSIESLPKGLVVERALDLMFTGISTFPKDIQVYGTVYLHETPLSKKYTSRELKKLYPGIQGKVFGMYKDNIFLFPKDSKN